MEKNEMKESEILQEIVDIILSAKSDAEIKNALDDYHENDIAEAIENLDTDVRQKLYRILDLERLAEILAYTDNVSDYLDELSPRRAADILEEMDADDAVDVLEEIDDTNKREQLIALMDRESSEDIRLINSFADDEIGHMMTTNYVTISKTYTIKEAMRSVISQAHENDNINTIYVVDENGKYAGAVELKDLIIARENDELEGIISKSYPSISALEKIQTNIERLKNYAEDSLPVLNDDKERLIISLCEMTNRFKAA